MINYSISHPIIFVSLSSPIYFSFLLFIIDNLEFFLFSGLDTTVPQATCGWLILLINIYFYVVIGIDYHYLLNDLVELIE